MAAENEQVFQVQLDAIEKKHGEVCFVNRFANQNIVLLNAGVLLTAKRQKLPINVMIQLEKDSLVAHHWSVKVPAKETSAFIAWGKIICKKVLERRRKSKSPEKRGLCITSVALWGRQMQDNDGQMNDADLVVYPDQSAGDVGNMNSGELISRDDSLDSSSAILAFESQKNDEKIQSGLVCKSCWCDADTHISEDELLSDEITATEARLAIHTAKKAGKCAEVARWLCSAYEFKLIRLLQEDPLAYMLLHMLSPQSLFRIKYIAQKKMIDLLQPMSGMASLHVFVRDLKGRPPELLSAVIPVGTLAKVDDGALAIIGNAMSDLNGDHTPVYTLACLLMVGALKSVSQSSALHLDMRLTRMCNGTPQFGVDGDEEECPNFIDTYRHPVLYQPKISSALNRYTLGIRGGIKEGLDRLSGALGLHIQQKADAFIVLNKRMPRIGGRQMFNVEGTVLPLCPIAGAIEEVVVLPDGKLTTVPSHHLPPVDPAFHLLSNAGILTTFQALERAVTLLFLLVQRASTPRNTRQSVVVDDPTMTTSQKQAAMLIRHEHICFVTGPAGTGKTTGLCKALCHFKGSILVMSDTNVAATTLANQLNNAIERAYPFGGSPTTVTRRVVFWMHATSKRDDIKNADIIILDEASMSSMETMVVLLQLAKPSCVVVLPGDPAQKSPISVGGVAGMPFRDIVHRQGIAGVVMAPLNIRASGTKTLATNFQHLRDCILTHPDEQKTNLEDLWAPSDECSFLHIDTVHAVFLDMKMRYGDALVPPQNCDVYDWALNSPSANTVVISELNAYISKVNKDMFTATSNARKLTTHKPFHLFIPGAKLMITKPDMWFIDETQQVDDGAKRRIVLFPTKTRLIVVSTSKTTKDTTMIRVQVVVEKRPYLMFVKRSSMEAVDNPFCLAWAIGTSQAQSITVDHVVYLVAASSFSPMHMQANGPYSAFTRAGKTLRILLLPQGKNRSGVERGHAWRTFKSFLKHLGKRSRHRPVTLLDLLMSKQKVRVGLGSIHTLGYVSCVTALIHLTFARESPVDPLGRMHCGSWISRSIAGYMFAVPVTPGWDTKWTFVPDDEKEQFNDYMYESIEEYRRKTGAMNNEDEIEDLTCVSDSDDDLFAIVAGAVDTAPCPAADIATDSANVHVCIEDDSDDDLFAAILSTPDPPRVASSLPPRSISNKRSLDEVKSTRIVSVDSDFISNLEVNVGSAERVKRRIVDRPAPTKKRKKNKSIITSNDKPELGSVSFDTFFSDLNSLQ